MKVSYNWLKEYLKCDLTPEQVAEAMTSIGIEVDAVEVQDRGLDHVVVAQVLTCEAHPDSDHLHVTPQGKKCSSPSLEPCSPETSKSRNPRSVA